MKLPLKTWPAPILLEPCRPWDFASPPQDHTQLEIDLVETMLEHEALGLAANQVGLSHRVFAMHLRQNGQVLVLYNPEIVKTSDATTQDDEGCLSFPRVRLPITRPSQVTGKWQNNDGAWQQRDFEGIDAKCFLHELDHLNGITFRSHVSDIKFALAVKKARRP